MLAVVWVYSPYEWEELYYRHVVIHQLQTRYGFRLEQVRAVTEGGLTYHRQAIVDVLPGGEFFRLGLRAGDTPFQFHGGGFTMMHHALETAERGGFSAFDVVNIHEGAPTFGFRVIPVYPLVREVPTSITRQKALLSPTGSLSAVSVESVIDDVAPELWLWDVARGTGKKVWGFNDVGPVRASATWSTEDQWLAVTERSSELPSRCVLIEASRGRALNMNDLLMSLPAHARPASHEGLECEIFGWVKDTPTRVAVIFRDLAANEGEPWIYNFFFDVTTRQFIMARR